MSFDQFFLAESEVPEAEELLEEAQDLFFEGNLQDAVSKTREALDKDPSFFQAYDFLHLLLSQIGESQEALKVCLAWDKQCGSKKSNKALSSLLNVAFLLDEKKIVQETIEKLLNSPKHDELLLWTLPLGCAILADIQDIEAAKRLRQTCVQHLVKAETEGFVKKMEIIRANSLLAWVDICQHSTSRETFENGVSVLQRQISRNLPQPSNEAATNNNNPTNNNNNNSTNNNNNSTNNNNNSTPKEKNSPQNNNSENTAKAPENSTSTNDSKESALLSKEGQKGEEATEGGMEEDEETIFSSAQLKMPQVGPQVGVGLSFALLALAKGIFAKDMGLAREILEQAEIAGYCEEENVVAAKILLNNDKKLTQNAQNKLTPNHPVSANIIIRKQFQKVFTRL